MPLHRTPSRTGRTGKTNLQTLATRLGRHLMLECRIAIVYQHNQLRGVEGEEELLARLLGKLFCKKVFPDPFKKLCGKLPRNFPEGVGLGVVIGLFCAFFNKKEKGE
jgi:hypothetical protein